MEIDFSTVPWWLVLLGLEVPPVLGVIDAATRPEHHFAGGVDDRKAWVRWLVVSVVTAPVLVGYLIVIAYYQVVIRPNSGAPRGSDR